MQTSNTYTCLFAWRALTVWHEAKNGIVGLTSAKKTDGNPSASQSRSVIGSFLSFFLRKKDMRLEVMLKTNTKFRTSLSTGMGHKARPLSMKGAQLA